MSFDPNRMDPETYDRLKALARRIYQEKAGRGTIQPTALLHEAWMRVNRADGAIQDRAHFMATAAVAMRHVMLDRARSRGRQKRGGPNQIQTTLSGLAGSGDDPVSFLDFHNALEELQEASPTDADVVLLRSMGGLTVAEVSTVLGVSPSTVERSWRRGRAFLASRLMPG